MPRDFSQLISIPADCGCGVCMCFSAGFGESGRGGLLVHNKEALIMNDKVSKVAIFSV